MNLLKEVEEAIKRAEKIDKNYSGPLKGFAGRGADKVWVQMSPEAQKKWSDQAWPQEILVHPKGLSVWAKQFGLDITNM